MFGTRGLMCGSQCTTPQKKKVELKTPGLASHSILLIFVRVLQPGCGYGQPLPERVCVHVKHSVVAKRGMFMWIEYLSLTDPSVLLGGSFCRSLRGVLCTSKTAFFCAGYFFRITFLSVLNFFAHSRVCTDLDDVEGQRSDNLAGAPSTIIVFLSVFPVFHKF